MGVIPGTGLDLANAKVEGAFTATGASKAFTPSAGTGFNITLYGAFAGTVALERSFDGGVNWVPVAYSDGTALSWTAPVSCIWTEVEGGVIYRLNCAAYTSGTVSYRLSQ